LRGNLKEKNRLNITLALDSEIFNELKKESEINNTSINARISTVLSKHVHFYRIVDELDRNIIPQHVFASMLEIMNEEQLCEIMKDKSVSSLYSMCTHKGISLTLDNITKYLFQQTCLWSGMYSAFHSYIDNDKTINMTFEHRYGIKWSRALGVTFSSMLENMLSTKINYEIMTNTIRIKISENSDKIYKEKYVLDLATNNS
jgi:hypothetical protein